jgi:hypothetical protein
MEFVRVFPPDINPDSRVYSVVYNREELLAMGMKKDSPEVKKHYLGLHELHKLRSLWTDAGYLADFFDDNKNYFRDPYWKGITAEKFALDVRNSAPCIFKELIDLHKTGRLDEIFERLGDRGKVKKVNNLVNVKAKFGYITGKIAFRMYAIKLEYGCYLITGGAIKIVSSMEDAPNTNVEIAKLNAVNSKLQTGGVFDDASFVDFMVE